MLGSFRDGWIDVAGVASHVLTWGGWLDDTLPPGGTILLFMCGVPGLTLFYKTFLEELHNRLKIPVWTICIAGHEVPPSNTSLILPKDKSLYTTVKAQVRHKLEFVKKYVPRDQKLIFMGHSFGGKMVVEILKDEELEKRTDKCILLMPTLERFADLPRAQFWLKMKRMGFVHLLALISWFLSLLPLSWRNKFSQWYFNSRGCHNVDQYFIEGMTQFSSTPLIFNNVHELVNDEISAIKDLDEDVLRKVSDRTKVYFAADDYWAPMTHYFTLKMSLPYLQVEILESEFEHAFTLRSAHAMANLIVHNLKENEE